MITRPIPAVVTAFVPLCLQFYDGAVPAMDTIEYDSRNEDDDGHIWMLAGNGKGGQVRQKPFVIQTIITVPSSKLLLFGPYTGLRRIRCCWFRVPRQKHRGIRVERWQCHLPIRMLPCFYRYPRARPNIRWSFVFVFTISILRCTKNHPYVLCFLQT